MAYRLLQWMLIVGLVARAAAAADPPAEGAKAGNLGQIVVSDEARRIHESALLVDGHNDLPWALRENGSSSFDKLDIAQPQPKLHTDIPRLRASGVKAQFWSVFVPADTRHSGAALSTTLEQIAIVRAMLKRYPETFEFAGSAADVERVCAAGKVASLIGVEGGHSIENSISVLRQLYAEGARYMTLTHSDTLDWADSATDDPRHGGLAPFGVEIIHEMNRLGMLVDLSHVSVATMNQALDVSQAPIIFSHSSARALADHPRNVPDEVLKRMAKNGGVVMVNFYPGFIVPEAAKRGLAGMAHYRELKQKFAGDDEKTRSEKVRAEMKRWYADHPTPAGSVHTVLDHIDHIAKTAGVAHVGLGSDYDGIQSVPEQLDDVSTYPRITQGLLDRGYKEAEIRQILGGNLLRALRGAEQVAERLRQEGTSPKTP
jgi:membrane dipeptidase